MYSLRDWYEEAARLRAEVAALRGALEKAYQVADSIWVDNVTGSADVSDPTPMKAEYILNLCKDALAAVPAPLAAAPLAAAEREYFIERCDEWVDDDPGHPASRPRLQERWLLIEIVSAKTEVWRGEYHTREEADAARRAARGEASDDRPR